MLKCLFSGSNAVGADFKCSGFAGEFQFKVNKILIFFIFITNQFIIHLIAIPFQYKI